MENYTAKIRIRHNKQWYKVGDTIALTPKEAEPLIADGAIDPNGTPIPEQEPPNPPDPKSVSVTDSEKSDSEKPSSKKPKAEA